MRKLLALGIALLFSAKTLAATTAITNQPNNDFISAIKNGKPILNFRLRNEDVFQQGKEDAVGNTLNLHLGYETGFYHSFSALFEFTNTSIIGNQLYNSGGGTSPSKTKYATINDPRGHRVDQAFLNYQGVWDSAIKLGRQRILLDDERFVGNAGFRQLEQVYDAVSINNKYFTNFNIFYAYINQVNRIWGPEGVGVFNSNLNHTNLLNLRYNGWKVVDVIGYGYFIDNATVPSFSTKTVGLRFTGSVPINQAYNVLYTLEYANQHNGYNNPVSYVANFSHLALGFEYREAVTIQLEREDLGGRKSVAGGAFRTPLASLHKFQGWNDLFNTTPTEGVVDNYLSVRSKLSSVFDLKVTGICHNFSASDGAKEFGKEIDLEIAKDLNRYLSANVQYANFFDSRDRRFPSTKKIWLAIKGNIL